MKLLPTAILGAINEELAALIAETAAVHCILNTLNIVVCCCRSKFYPLHAVGSTEH